MDSLSTIKKWAEDIAGSWDGDKSGSLEDKAHQAQEILEKISELESLIDGMDDL